MQKEKEQFLNTPNLQSPEYYGQRPDNAIPSHVLGGPRQLFSLWIKRVATWKPLHAELQAQRKWDAEQRKKLATRVSSSVLGNLSPTTSSLTQHMFLPTEGGQADTFHCNTVWFGDFLFVTYFCLIFLFDAGHHFVLLVLNLRQSSCLSLWILAFSVIRYLLLLFLKFTVEVDGVDQWPGGYLAHMRHWILFPASQVKSQFKINPVYLEASVTPS